MVQNIVEPRQTLPILANVLLEARSEGLRLTATDLEVGARVAVPATVARPGAITLSARKLVEIVQGAARRSRVAFKVQRQRRGSSCAAGARRTGWSGCRPRSIPPVGPGRGRRVAHRGGRAPARHARADELRHLARREPLRPERRAISSRGSKRCGWWRPTAIGWRSRGAPSTGTPEMAGIVPRKAVQEITRVLGGGRGGRARGRRESVRRADAERALTGAADRGTVPELRAGHPEGAPAPAWSCERGRCWRRSAGCRSWPRSGHKPVQLDC